MTDGDRALLDMRQYRIDHPSGVGPVAHIVAQKDKRRVRVPQPRKKRPGRIPVSVRVADEEQRTRG